MSTLVIFTALTAVTSVCRRCHCTATAELKFGVHVVKHEDSVQFKNRGYIVVDEEVGNCEVCKTGAVWNVQRFADTEMAQMEADKLCSYVAEKGQLPSVVQLAELRYTATKECA